MALFGSGKGKKDEVSSELVLAYIEDAQRCRTAFRLSDGKGREISANLIGLSAANGLGTFQLQGPLPGEKGSRILATCILDGLRIGGSFEVISLRTGQADLALPEELKILERRKNPRAKLNPREAATLTALTGMFEGLGLTGIIDNLSETGARVRVERALEIKGEKKQSLHTSLIEPGHVFGILKLSKLPRLPGAWECSGHGVYLEGGSAALFLGVAFSSFPSEAMGVLRSLISSRVGSQPSVLPPKARRNQEPELAAEVVPAPKRPDPVVDPEKRKPEPPPQQPVVEPVIAPPVMLTPEPPGPTRNSALLRLKKRSRTLVVVATPGNAHRLLLVDHLNEEGYGKVLVTQTLQELLELLEESKPSLLFIEDGVAELQGIDLLEALHRVDEDLPPIILAQGEISTATVLAAKRLGVANLMVKPYDLDNDFSAILESALGL